MEYLKYIREYLAGFRMPNLKKLWYGSDEVDSSNSEPILVQVRLCLKITLEMFYNFVLKRNNPREIVQIYFYFCAQIELFIYVPLMTRNNTTKRRSQMEYYLVKGQELALWTDPQSSAIALGVVHIFFAYVATTSNTTLNLGK